MKKSFELCRIMSFILVFIFFLSFSLQASPYDAMEIIINDRFIKNSPKTVLINDVVYIPLSQLQDNLGIKVYFQEDDRSYRIYWWSNLLYINKEKNIIMVNNEYKAHEHAVEIINGVLYIPEDMLVEILGFRIEKIDSVKGFRIITNDKVVTAEELLKMREEEKKAKPAIGKYNGPKVAYITFDDGIVRGNSEKILDILREKNVKATFFVLGNTISRNQDILKRMAEEGHSIGNHSYSHRKEIIYKSSDSLKNEIDKTSDLILETIGKAMYLFRPPYGSKIIKGQNYQKVLKDYKVILWNVDSNDSRVKDIKAEQIYKNVVAQVQNKRSAIILMHETKTESVKALPLIIDYLIESGFEIKAIEEDEVISYK